MNVGEITSKYRVMSLRKEHIPRIFALCAANTDYYRHMKMQPTPENLEEVFTICPPGVGMEDKCFLGFFDQADRLTAILDLCTNYPQTGKAFIGWFMVDAELHRSGIGRKVVCDLLGFLKELGFSEVRLGCIKSNHSAISFWTAMGFNQTGTERETEQFTILEFVLTFV